MEAVFPGNNEQERVARERGLTIPIVTGARFYLAEDYHQKYRLRHDKTLMREFADYTPRQFVESRVAARLNGYIAGKGSPEQLRTELESFGLSSPANGHLEKLVAHRAA